MSCLSTEDLQQDAIGATIEITVEEDGVAVNLASVTAKDLYFKKPNGTVLQKPASFVTNGADGKLQYVTQAGDLDRAGTWKVQAYLQFPGGGYDGRGEIGEFRVKGNLG